MTRWQDEHGIPVDDSGRYDAALIDWRVLEDLPTLSEGQADDMKIDSGTQRVWLSRCTTLDGEHCDHHVTVEAYDGNCWSSETAN